MKLDTSLAGLQAAHDKARADLSAGNVVGAREVYRAAVQGLLAGADFSQRLSAAALTIFDQLADLEALLENRPAAEALLRLVEAAAREAGNTEAADFAALKRADLATQSGDLEAARAALAGLRPRLPDLETLDLSSFGLARWEGQTGWLSLGPGATAMLIAYAYRVLGAMLIHLGQYREAAAVLDRAIARLTGTDAPEVAARTAPQLALARCRAAFEYGDLHDALARVQACAASCKELDELRRQELMVLIHFARGELGDALAGARTFAAACRKRGLERAANLAELNLCRMLISINQTRLAEDMLHATGLRADRLGDGRLRAAVGELEAMAAARRASGARETALGPSVSQMQFGEPELDTVKRHRRPTLRSGMDLPFAARFDAFAAETELRLALADAKETRRALSALIEICRKTDSPLALGRVDLLRGLCLLKEGQAGAAIEPLTRAISSLEALGAIPWVWQGLRGLIDALHRAAPDSEPLRELIARSEAILQRLELSLDEADRATYRLNKATAEEERLAAAVDALAAQKAAVAKATGWNGRKLHRRFQAALRRFSKDLDAKRIGLGAEAAKRNPLANLWAILSARSERRGAVTVGYLVLPDRLVVIVQRADQLDLGVTPVTRLALRDWVADWHQAAGKVMSDGRADVVAGNAADAALGTITDALRLDRIVRPDTRQLRVVADDVLHGFPFSAAFWDDKYLIDRCSVANDLTIFGTARHRRGPGLRRAALLAVSEYPEPYPDLPGAAAEIEAVDRTLRSAGVEIVAVPKGTTGRALIALAAECQLLHVACHGEFAPGAPDRTGLVLASASGRAEIFSLEQINSTKLHGIVHATLSACSLADAYISPGRLVVSLPQTLARAGVGAVLSPLWPIADVVAERIIASFYRYCLDYDRAEALRRAQLDCRDMAFQDFSAAAPVFWAAFSLWGDASKLAMPGRGKLRTPTATTT
jgi:CHAT domain-containing protein